MIKTITKKEKRRKPFLYATADIHNFCHRGTDAAKRKLLDIGSIFTNAAICHLCGWFIRSRNRHDFVTCKCGALSVDGGSWYCKRSGNPQDYTDVIEYFEDVKHE